jgi:hypothetical protein
MSTETDRRGEAGHGRHLAGLGEVVEAHRFDVGALER